MAERIVASAKQVLRIWRGASGGDEVAAACCGRVSGEVLGNARRRPPAEASGDGVEVTHFGSPNVRGDKPGRFVGPELRAGPVRGRELEERDDGEAGGCSATRATARPDASGHGLATVAVFIEQERLIGKTTLATAT